MERASATLALFHPCSESTAVESQKARCYRIRGCSTERMEANRQTVSHSTLHPHRRSPHSAGDRETSRSRRSRQFSRPDDLGRLPLLRYGELLLVLLLRLGFYQGHEQLDGDLCDDVEDLPWTNGALGVDHSLPRHSIAIVASVRLVGGVGEVLEADADLPARFQSDDMHASTPTLPRPLGCVR